MMEVSDKLALLREFTSLSYNLYFTVYNEDYSLLSTNAEMEEAIHLLLAMDYWAGDQTELISENDLDYYSKRPNVVENSLKMIWISEVENSKPKKIHVMGPVFTDDFSVNEITNKLEHMNLMPGLKREFTDFIKKLPVVSIIRFYEYGLMLHYCLTGEKITNSDFIYLQKRSEPEQHDLVELKHGTYAAEQAMLKFVREGNLQYRKEIDRLASFGNIGKLATKDATRQAKNSVIVFITLCCRAAITGGLPSETAYLLSDRYIQSVEDANSISALTDVSHTMLDDYIRRVHRVNAKKGITPQIQLAIDHIGLYPDEKLDVHALAEKVGLTDYYFTKKFKKEVGMTVNEFVLEQKIERAKALLVEGKVSVSELGVLLGYSSSSYFGDMFRKQVGCTPGEYRASGGNVTVTQLLINRT
jgi:AraC-like DNA-binding protein